MQRFSVTIVIAVTAMTISTAHAQVPGDGLPDFYYFKSDQTIMTSFGEISRPAGTMLLDTDGEEVTAFFISGPDVSTVGCYLCDGMNLPEEEASLDDASTWDVAYVFGMTQWIRIHPLASRGFVGAISVGFVDILGDDYPWPTDSLFYDFPDPGTGLAMYAPGLTEDDFPRIFPLYVSSTYNVQYSNNDGVPYFTNVTILPEPHACGALGLGLLLLVLGARRRVIR